MYSKVFLIALSLLLLPVLSIAKHMAVLETISQKDLLTLQEKQYLTDVLRSQAVRVLPAEQNWTIMTRENINVMLPPGKSIEDCEGTCLAETGRNIAADFVAQARISKFGSSYAISVELYETSGNKLVASINGRGETIEDLEKILKEQAAGFFKKARGTSWEGSGIGDFSSAGAFSFQGNKKYVVFLKTIPVGAIPTVDGKAIPKCTSTPCTILLEPGEHRFVFSQERFDDKDTVVNVMSDSQKVILQLYPSVGSLDLKPAIKESLNKYPLTMTIDGKSARRGKNELSPGVHEVHIEHPCYDPISFKVAIQKGKVETFSNSLPRGVGGLELETTRGNELVSVPVYFDGEKVGMTPYSGEVPMCAKIDVGEPSEWERVAVDLKWHDVVKVVHEMKPAKDVAVAPKDEIRDRANDAYAELDSGKQVPKQSEPKKESPKKEPPAKRLWGGAFIAATYNDFYGTKFGFGDLKSGDDYTLKLSGADNLLGNYWGFGGNIGIGGLFLLNSNMGIRADLGIASRRGTGKSDVTVKLYWDDASRQPEKSDLEIDFYVKQINIDLPVTFRYIFPNSLYAELGPMMSFNLYSKTKFEVTDIYGTEEFREHDCFNVFEFDAVAGVGMMRYIGKSMLDFNLRFVLGVTPLSDANDAPRTWQGQFNIAYWFI